MTGKGSSAGGWAGADGSGAGAGGAQLNVASPTIAQKIIARITIVLFYSLAPKRRVVTFTLLGQEPSGHPQSSG